MARRHGGGPARRRGAILLATLALLGCGGDDDGPPGGAGPREGAVGASPTTASADARLQLLTGLYAPPSGPSAGLFTPCGTDRVLTVAPDGGAEALWRRVLLDGAGEDGATRVTVRAGIVESGTGGDASSVPGASGTLRIQEVVAVARISDCPDAPAARPLEGTAWQLVGVPAPDPGVQGAGAWLRLRPEPAVVEGSTGCRDLTGRYDWTVTRLRFSRLDASPAMCPEAALHADFLAALGRTGSYRVRGDTLELLGEAGVVATFVAPER